MPRHFGTRLHTKKLKNLPPATFFTLFALSGFDSLWFNAKNERNIPYGTFLSFFWWNRGETAATHPDCLPTQMPRHFGTRLRTKKLKNLPPATFFTLFALSGFDSLWFNAKNERNIPCGTFLSFFGGTEGSRTPVRKHIHTGISERSHLLKIPSAARQVTAQAVLVASFVMHGAKLNHVTFTTVWRSYPDRGPSGKNGCTN